MDEFVGGGLAVEPQLAGHLVEGVGELAQFVVAADGQHLVEIALAEVARGFGQTLDGPQHHAAEAVGEEQSQRQRGGDGQQHDARGLAGGFAGVVVLLRHGALVDALDRRGGVEQFAQRRLQAARLPRLAERQSPPCRNASSRALQLFGRLALAGFGDDRQFGVHVAAADGRLLRPGRRGFAARDRAARLVTPNVRSMRRAASLRSRIATMLT